MLSVVALTLPRERQEAVAGAVRETVLSPFLELQARWTASRETRSAIARLRRERDELAARVVAQQDLVREVARLRALLGLAERAPRGYVAANLIPSGRGGAELQTFLLDVGRRQGVVPPAPVVTPDGLVGVVRSAGADHAAGDFWTHPDFRVSAMTEDGEVFGIVRPVAPRRGEPPALLLTGVPYQVELAPGTRIVTSGLGGVFPRGVPVGRVLELARAEEGWSRTYRLAAAVHPGAAFEVLVLTGGAAVDWSAPWAEAAEDAASADTAGGR